MPLVRWKEIATHSVGGLGIFEKQVTPFSSRFGESLSASEMDQNTCLHLQNIPITREVGYSGKHLVEHFVNEKIGSEFRRSLNTLLAITLLLLHWRVLGRPDTRVNGSPTIPAQLLRIIHFYLHIWTGVPPFYARRCLRDASTYVTLTWHGPVSCVWWMMWACENSARCFYGRVFHFLLESMRDARHKTI